MVSLYNYFIYKVLRLSAHAIDNMGSGKIMNLLANDVNTVELVHYFLNFLWVSDRKTTITIHQML